MWPQITIIVLIAVAVTQAMIKHGEPKRENHSFFVTVIGALIEVGVLYAGGFFDVLSK